VLLALFRLQVGEMCLGSPACAFGVGAETDEADTNERHALNRILG